MNLKKYFDAANAAEARVQSIAAQINELFDAGRNDEALALRPELDKAKASATEAHQLYLSMQSATSGGVDPAARFVPMGGEQEPRAVTNCALRRSIRLRSGMLSGLEHRRNPFAPGCTAASASAC